MDLRKLKTLIDLVSESNISELEITEAEGKVRIVKAGAAVAAAPLMMAAPVMAPPPAAAAAPVPAGVGGASAAAPAPEAPPAPEGKMVKSPMVGTFYRAATPGGKPFADIGDAVSAGQAICIIEAMKIMNEIESDIEGRIVQILAQNGQAVEFGQPLFVLE
jgi:acetyl-CoA carboxylase biotin carboxyl carrier protein